MLKPYAMRRKSKEDTVMKEGRAACEKKRATKMGDKEEANKRGLQSSRK